MCIGYTGFVGISTEKVMSFLFFMFLDHKKAADDVSLRKQMTFAKHKSVSKSESAVKTAMANVYFLAKEDLPNNMVQQMNSFLLYQVHKFIESCKI